jgi:peptidoglycan hydrolase-like protein with peptidoglycan-binding domain
LVPIHDLQVGSRSIEVVWLQSFLIAANEGTASQSLATAGATGYFGPITRAALAEYQGKAGIVPAAGYFGPLTRAYVSALFAPQ